MLYAASNLGSFAALLFYPFLLEPLVSLRGQARLWSTGFAVLAVLIALAGLFVSRVAVVPAAPAVAAPKPGMAERLGWMALAAIPSGLVIAVTAHITTDVAAAPFLWVVPLALYLLTFVALFRERPWVRHKTIIKLVPFVVAALAISVLGSDKVFWLATIALNLMGFLMLAMLCHGELYGRRPAPARLTEFYLWVSVGGVLGGIFAGLLAPHLFSSTYEYPILIAVALLMLPGTFTQGREGFLREAGPALALAALVAAPRFLFDVQLPQSANCPFQIGLVALAGLMLLYRQRPARLFSLVVLAFVVTGVWQPGLARVENARSFFGVHKVLETADGRHRLLFHGTTIHGAEKVREANGMPRHRSAGAADLLLFRRADLGGDRSRARRPRAGCARSPRSGSAPAVSLVTSGTASAGLSSRSIRKWCALRATRSCSGSSPSVRRGCPWCWATHG